MRATDHAFWRRPKLIDFAVTIPDEGQDKVLPAKLKAEASGILAWAVRGCLRWQQSGLAEPESVQKATRAYRSDEDTLRQFIAECCVTDNRVQVKLSVLRERYAQWCKERGEREFSSRRFGEYLKSAGFENYHSGGTWYRGIDVSGDAHGGQIEIWSERGAVCDVT